MAFKCAKTYGPAIIYFDNIELAFPRKMAKKEFRNYMKNLHRHIRAIKYEQQVVCIGCLKVADTKHKLNRLNLIKLFKPKTSMGRNKFYFPWPDYGTRR